MCAVVRVKGAFTLDKKQRLATFMSGCLQMLLAQNVSSDYFVWDYYASGVLGSRSNFFIFENNLYSYINFVSLCFPLFLLMH